MPDDRLFLPDVTLLTFDNGAAIELTKLAIQDATSKVRFRNTIFVSEFEGGHESPLWYTAPTLVTTSHVLLIQYDSWILDASLWRESWLSYDYVGAPWPWKKEFRVGNSGFSLRSKRLMDFLVEHKDEFPLKVPEDHVLSHVYRPALEQHGFKWAPESVAREFSFEREPPHPTFGFHGIFNWTYVLAPHELAFRRSLATDYVRSKREWKELG